MKICRRTHHSNTSQVAFGGLFVLGFVCCSFLDDWCNANIQSLCVQVIITVFIEKVLPFPKFRSILLYSIQLFLAFYFLLFLGTRNCCTSLNTPRFTLNHIMSFSLDIDKSDIFCLFISLAIKIFGQSAFHELAQNYILSCRERCHALDTLSHIGFYFRGE